MASEESGKPRSRAWIVVLCIVLLVFIIPAAVLYLRLRDVDDVTRDWVVRALSERFESRVELESIHVTAFPEMSATGEKLAIYYHNRTDVPPMIQIQQFTFHLGFMGILRVPRHIRGVHLDNMVISVPPRGQPPGEPAPPPPTKIKKPLPRITIDQVVCDNTTLLILPKQSRQTAARF